MKVLLTEQQLERLKFFLINKKEATKLLESKLKDKSKEDSTLYLYD